MHCMHEESFALTSVCALNIKLFGAMRHDDELLGVITY